MLLSSHLKARLYRLQYTHSWLCIHYRHMKFIQKDGKEAQKQSTFKFSLLIEKEISSCGFAPSLPITPWKSKGSAKDTFWRFLTTPGRLDKNRTLMQTAFKCKSKASRRWFTRRGVSHQPPLIVLADYGSICSGEGWCCRVGADSKNRQLLFFFFALLEKFA